MRRRRRRRRTGTRLRPNGPDAHRRADATLRVRRVDHPHRASPPCVPRCSADSGTRSAARCRRRHVDARALARVRPPAPRSRRARCARRRCAPADRRRARFRGSCRASACPGAFHSSTSTGCADVEIADARFRQCDRDFAAGVAGQREDRLPGRDDLAGFGLAVGDHAVARRTQLRVAGLVAGDIQLRACGLAPGPRRRRRPRSARRARSG